MPPAVRDDFRPDPATLAEIAYNDGSKLFDVEERGWRRAFGYEGESSTPPDVAARVLWLDAFTANVDRTWRNPNLLLWHDDLWVIDHGASLYFHHAWPGAVTDPARFAAQPWSAADHRASRAGSAVPRGGTDHPSMPGRSRSLQPAHDQRAST